MTGKRIALTKAIEVENNDFRGGFKSSLAKYKGRGYHELKAALVLGFGSWE